VEVIDLRAPPDSSEQLQKWLDEHGDAVLVNRKSTTWRGLDDQAHQQPVLALLMANPTLIKRPVIESGDNSFVGWTAEVQTALGLT
jgi:arsenate reductase